MKKMLVKSILLGLILSSSMSAASAAITEVGDLQIEKLVDGYNSDEDIKIASTNNLLNGIRAGLNNANVSLTGSNIDVNMVLDGDFQSTYTITGVFSGGFSDSDNKGTYGDGAKLTLGGGNTKNININVYANGSGKDGGHGAIGLWAYNQNGNSNHNGGRLEVNAENLKIDVHAEESWAYGLLAQNCTTPQSYKGNEKAALIINADNTLINVTSGTGSANGIVAMSQGILEVNGNLEVNADSAISARGDAIVKINASNDKIVKLNGDIDFNYDEKTSRTGVDADVLVNLSGAESYWNGNATVSYGTGKITPEEKAEVTGLKLGISDGAQWNPNFVEEYENDESGVKAIALNQVEMNGGIINLENAADQTIRIETLSGAGGTINLANEKNALAITKANQAKSLTVAATSDYAEALASNDMASSAQKVANQVIDETADTSTQTAATDVYIPETAVTGAYTAKVEDGLVVGGQEAVNSTNKAVSEMANHNLMVWRLENNDMNKRLGELRDSKGEHGVWVRMTRGEGKYKSIKNQYNAYQLGYDEKLSADKSWTVGAAFTYTDGETSFATGSGENKHKGFAVYGSKLNKDGSFIDLIAKYSRLDNEFKAVAGIGNGEYETNGYSVSAEYGKRFTKANGFWIEPQVELTYGKVGSASYVTSRGVLAQQEGMESLVGRIGFAAGKNFKRGNAYVRASYLYDFDGDTKVTYSNASAARSIEDDLGGGWFEVGIGSNINLSEATHLYVDIEKTYGGDVAVPWQWNVGLRYSF